MAADETPATLVLSAEVEVAEQLGAEVIAYLRGRDVETETVGERSFELDGALVARFEGRTPVYPGAQLRLTVDMNELHVFHPETGVRITSS